MTQFEKAFAAHKPGQGVRTVATLGITVTFDPPPGLDSDMFVLVVKEFLLAMKDVDDAVKPVILGREV